MVKIDDVLYISINPVT